MKLWVSSERFGNAGVAAETNGTIEIDKRTVLLCNGEILKPMNAKEEMK